MYIRVLNKASELDDQTAKSLKCSSSITARLLNYSCCAQSKRSSSKASYLWISLRTFSLFISRQWSRSQLLWLYELKTYPLSALTCKGAEVLASCDQERHSGSSSLRGGYGVGLAALWLSGLSKASTSLLPCMGWTGRETFLRSPLDH